MRLGPLLFRITGIVIFVQIALGGLLTFGFIDPTAHIVTGLIVFVLALASMVTVLVSKPVFMPLRGISIGLVVLIVIQIVLGLETLRTNSLALAWIHFLVAMGIYGMSVAGTFMTMRWDRMARSPAPATATAAQ
jgi:hypothetical protein